MRNFNTCAITVRAPLPPTLCTSALKEPKKKNRHRSRLFADSGCPDAALKHLYFPSEVGFVRYLVCEAEAEAGGGLRGRGQPSRLSPEKAAPARGARRPTPASLRSLKSGIKASPRRV
ncbi:hypothetical protein SRHO_G00016760 [Serrasalmus rhombeus]